MMVEYRYSNNLKKNDKNKIFFLIPLYSVISRLK